LNIIYILLLSDVDRRKIAVSLMSLGFKISRMTGCIVSCIMEWILHKWMVIEGYFIVNSITIDCPMKLVHT
jgi:hypothetical protein